MLSGLICSQESTWVGSGGPPSAPVCDATVAVGLFAAPAAPTALPAMLTPITNVPPLRRNDLREK